MWFKLVFGKLWSSLCSGSYQLSSRQYPKFLCLNFSLKVKSILFNFSGNNKLQMKWGLHQSFLLSPAVKCCWLLVSDREGKVNERTSLANHFFFSPSVYYQDKKLTEKCWIVEFTKKSCLLTSCWLVNSWTNEKILPHPVSFPSFLWDLWPSTNPIKLFQKYDIFPTICVTVY